MVLTFPPKSGEACARRTSAETVLIVRIRVVLNMWKCGQFMARLQYTTPVAVPKALHVVLTKQQSCSCGGMVVGVLSLGCGEFHAA